MTSATLYFVRDSVPAATAVLLLVLWVVGAAGTGDRVAGLVAALSGAAWFDFFLTRPYLTFSISDRDDVEAAVLLVVISVAVTEIALWGHRQQAGAARRAGYLDGVVMAARSVSDSETPSRTLTRVIGHQIADVLGADGASFVDGPVHDVRIALLDYDGVLMRRGRRVDVARVGLPTDEYIAILVHQGGRVCGHFLVSATSQVTRPTIEQRQVAVVLADQVGRAVSAGRG